MCNPFRSFVVVVVVVVFDAVFVVIAIVQMTILCIDLPISGDWKNDTMED